MRHGFTEPPPPSLATAIGRAERGEPPRPSAAKHRLVATMSLCSQRRGRGEHCRTVVPRYCRRGEKRRKNRERENVAGLSLHLGCRRMENAGEDGWPPSSRHHELAGKTEKKAAALLMETMTPRAGEGEAIVAAAKRHPLPGREKSPLPMLPLALVHADEEATPKGKRNGDPLLHRCFVRPPMLALYPCLVKMTTTMEERPELTIVAVIPIAVVRSNLRNAFVVRVFAAIHGIHLWLHLLNSS
nr:hypothetical protein Iba_chr04fCG14660 [Ipomoea batatas]